MEIMVNFVNLMSSTCSSFYWLSSPLVGRSSVVKDSAQVLIIYRRLADEVPNVLSTAGTVMPMTAPLTMISSIVRYRVARVSFSPLDCVRSWIGTGAGTNECLDRTLTSLHRAITPLINEITSSLAGDCYYLLVRYGSVLCVDGFIAGVTNYVVVCGVGMGRLRGAVWGL